jgi:hypothetical protein
MIRSKKQPLSDLRFAALSSKIIQAVTIGSIRFSTFRSSRECFSVLASTESSKVNDFDILWLQICEWYVAALMDEKQTKMICWKVDFLFFFFLFFGKTRKVDFSRTLLIPLWMWPLYFFSTKFISLLVTTKRVAFLDEVDAGMG